MNRNANCQKNILTTMGSVVIFSTVILLFMGTTSTQGQQQRFFLPSSNNANFAVQRVQFPPDETVGPESAVPQRRLSSAESNAGTQGFFPSQQQLPPGTFTNSGPFSRPPNAQPFILNGQQVFQPVRNAGSLSFTDISPPSQFQQAPLQRPQQPQQPLPQQQPFNFFSNGSQQPRFRPIVQQRPEQQDFTDDFEERQNAQSSLILQSADQERFNGDLSRRPASQPNGIIPAARNPTNTGSVRWWHSAIAGIEPTNGSVIDDEESTAEAKDGVVDFNQQRQTQQPKRGRSQPQPPQQQQQGRRRPATTALPPQSVSSLGEQQEPAAIGFTVIHDEDDDRSSWSQPAITTHRPQTGQTSFRGRNPPAAVSGSIINWRPTTYNPLASFSTEKSLPLQPSSSTATVNKQQPTTIRGRKPPLFLTTTTTTTTSSPAEDERDQEEQFPTEEKRPFHTRKPFTTTTQQPFTVPITTLRAINRPRLNTPVPSAPQQLRMKKIVNNPAIVQSIVTRKPTTTSTTLASTTSVNTNHTVLEEYEEYEDPEFTTTAYTTTELPSNKKPIKSSPVTLPSTVKSINQKSNISSTSTTESWVVVASVQTSRSVSSSMLNSGAIKNITAQESPTSTASSPINKHKFNNKPTITTTSTTTIESIIDKLDRVQSELSNGILYGSSGSNNSSSILTDLQNSGNNDDKRNDAIISSFTTPRMEKSISTSVSTTTSTTTTTSRPTTEKEENEDEEKEEEEEEDSDDSNKESTFVRKFLPSKQRTSTAATFTTTSTTAKPLQAGKKKSLIDTVKFDELLTSGLLPPGFSPKSIPAYKSKTITTTTTNETPLPVTNTVSTTQSAISSTSINTTPSVSSTTLTTTTTISAIPKSSGLNIKFIDDSSALASLLPPGFKLEDSIKPLETLSPSLLPPGFKLPAETENSANKLKENETVSTTAEVPLSTTTIAATSAAGIVFPSSGKTANNSGTRKPLPSNKKIQASVTLAPVIQKGWPVRATTEFTGWSTPSTTPFSIEKLLSQSKSPDLAAMASTLEPTTSTTTTTTTTTTTMKPPPTTTPGQCSESDSVCELVGTVRLVGSGSEKWVPELLDHNTAEWRLLANEVETQLDKVYSKSPALSKWYKKITIDTFSPGSNGANNNGKPDKNAGVLVDYFVELNKLGRTVNTADIRRLFHETLQKDGNLGSSAQPLQYGGSGDYEGPLLKLGRFAVDPARTDFIVLPKPTRGVSSVAGKDDAWLPQWAVAVMVIGLASILFVLIFGLTVLVSRKKNNKKVPPPTMQPTSMMSDDHHQQIYGTGKNGPTAGSRHMLHHPPSHSNSNYNISSYGYDNYAIDDDMMMLDEDDLEDVDRLYDMDAVWTDHDHDREKLNIPSTNGATKKHRADTQHGGHYDSWRSTALAPQTLTPIQTGYYSGGPGYGYGTDPNGYAADRRHYHRGEAVASATNPRSHHHYQGSHHNPNSTSYTTSPRKPPQQYHPDYDTDF